MPSSFIVGVWSYIQPTQTPEAPFYKDGTQADDGDGVPWSTAYKQLLYNTTYYPGEGVTTYFIIANVPQPTQQNPITKLILSDPGMQNAPGYPKLYRLLDPIVRQ